MTPPRGTRAQVSRDNSPCRVPDAHGLHHDEHHPFQSTTHLEDAGADVDAALDALRHLGVAEVGADARHVERCTLWWQQQRRREALRVAQRRLDLGGAGVEQRHLREATSGSVCFLLIYKSGAAL